MPSKFAVRPVSHQPQQVGYGLKQPKGDQPQIIRPEPGERRCDRKPEEQQWDVPSRGLTSMDG
ncbi:MAG TPA: hypothetical protein VGK58_09440 [Lacipirellulaceae bacterium]